MDIHIDLEGNPEWEGWKEEAAPEVYKGDALFDLINGGAELFFEYGFVQVISYKFKHKDGSRISAEMYQMASDSSAFGIFSLQKPADFEPVDIGQEAIRKEHFIAAWKNDHYLLLSGDMANDEHIGSLPDLGRLLSDKIEEDGRKPAYVDSLELDTTARVIYFRGNIGLSNVYSFDYKDVFKIEDGAVLKSEDIISVVFRYSDPGKCIQTFTVAHDHFVDHSKFTDFTDMDAYFAMTDRKGRRVTFSQYEHYLVGVVHAPEMDGPDLIDRVVSNLR